MVALFVVLMIALVLIVDLSLQTWRRRRGIATTPGSPTVPLPEWALLPVTRLQFPQGLFYGRGHTWARLEENGHMRVGIDDFLNHAIGPIDDIRFVERGTRVQRGEPIARITQGDVAVWVRSPVSGIVQATNRGLYPTVVRAEPYDAGWLAEMEPEDPAIELASLRVGRRIKEWIEAEALRFARFLAGNGAGVAMATMQDGGTPVDRRLSALGPEWAGEFSLAFLAYAEENR